MIRPEMLCPSWPQKPLGEVVDFLDHLRRPVTDRDRVSGPYPYYGANGQQDSVADYIFDEPLILMAEDGGYFGDPDRTIAYRVDGKCWVNNHAHVLRPKDGVDIGFLCRQLEKYDVTKFIKGATRQKLNKSSASEIPITLPPLAEQKRIAAILDKADAIRRKRRQTIQLADEFLRSVFLDMFGDPIRNTKNFPVKPLGELASIKRGRFSPRPRNDPRYYGGNYPFIQTGDINECDSLLLNWKQTLNENGIKVSYAFQKDTVLIAIVGATIGATAILGFKSYAPDSVIGIVPQNGNLTAEYLEYSLRFWRPVFLMRAPQTARANINIGTLKPLGLPTPDFELQKNFSTIYRTILKLKRRYHCFTDDLFNALFQRAFRGEL
ncbi:MAG: restriction endonuclease subunit S [Desulfobacterales bacterium]|nr:MAG: restriction endonuclease subunit S [Desulfobacterales bacterium]